MEPHIPKAVPASLLALGSKNLPDEIQVLGASYRLSRIFKNDFFAVTALYVGTNGKVILKVSRQASFLLIPLRWLGRLLAAKESAVLSKLAGDAGFPRFLDRWGETGIVREYLEGRPMRKGEAVPDDFHRQLQELMERLHGKGMAYVDLEKCENVLVGADDRPYLFDFQISWYLPVRWGGELWPARLLRRRLQAADRYHLVKLQRRTRPDQLTPEALAASYRKPWYVRLQGAVARPLTLARRAILRRVDPRRKNGERGLVSEQP